jgi:hypothetical protein
MNAGPVRFCRYAYAPNAQGFCGPVDARAVLEHGAAGEVGPDLVRLARDFEGAWPYLELIAGANGIADPLDERVVEAYWVGNGLLDGVRAPALGGFVEERFRPRLGARWSALSEARLERCRPHHNFHVFVVYPWLGMLRLGHTVEPLHVIERCRIRWGTVERVQGDVVDVTSRPLVYDGVALALGAPRTEQAVAAVDGYSFVADLAAGDVVSLHWDWVCERLGARDVRALARETARALVRANEILRLPGSVLS